jgi:hypothetical protein
MKSYDFTKALAVVWFASGLLISPAWASGKHHNKWDRKVALVCARANNIALPNKNTQLSANQLATMHSCEKQYRSNLQTCMNNASVSMSTLSRDQIPALRKCEAQAVSQIKSE